MEDVKIFQVSDKGIYADYINKAEATIEKDYGEVKLLRTPSGKLWVAFGETHFLSTYGDNCFQVSYNMSHIGDAGSSRNLYLNELTSYIKYLKEEQNSKYNYSQMKPLSIPTLVTKLITLHVQAACSHAVDFNLISKAHPDLLEDLIKYYLRSSNLPEEYYTSDLLEMDRPKGAEPLFDYKGIEVYRNGLAWESVFYPCNITEKTAVSQTLFLLLDMKDFNAEYNYCTLHDEAMDAVRLLYPYRYSNGSSYYGTDVQELNVSKFKASKEQPKVLLEECFKPGTTWYKNKFDNYKVKFSFWEELLILELKYSTYIIAVDPLQPFIIRDTILHLLGKEELKYRQKEQLDAMLEKVRDALPENNSIKIQLTKEFNWLYTKEENKLWDIYFYYNEEEDI